MNKSRNWLKTSSKVRQERATPKKTKKMVKSGGREKYIPPSKGR